MELAEIGRRIAGVYEYLDKGWRGYDVKPVPAEDFQVAVAAMIDHLDATEGPASIELPNADLRVERDEEHAYHVWVRINEVDPEVDNVE